MIQMSTIQPQVSYFSLYVMLCSVLSLLMGLENAGKCVVSRVQFVCGLNAVFFPADNQIILHEDKKYYPDADEVCRCECSRLYSAITIFFYCFDCGCP